MKKLKTKHWILIGIGAILTIGGTWFIIHKNRQKKGYGLGLEADEMPEKQAEKALDKELKYLPTGEEIGSKEKIPSNYPVVVGAKGRYVALLQVLLNFLHGAGVVVDGEYGANTRSAVQKYLGRYCWVGDCKVDSNALATLIKEAQKKKGWDDYIKKNTGLKKVYSKYSSEKVALKK